jgi:hypothetical protein
MAKLESIGFELREDLSMIRPVGEEELRTVRGGGILSRIKSAARWVKKHVVIGLRSVGIKGTF